MQYTKYIYIKQKNHIVLKIVCVCVLYAYEDKIFKCMHSYEREAKW